MNLKILTFNWHEPYICNQSLLGHSWFVVAPEVLPGKVREWDTRMRPLPENARVVSGGEAQGMLRNGEFDLAVAHNVKDLVWLKPFDLPKLCVFHCRLTTEIALSQTPIDKNAYLEKVKSLLPDVHCVFISENKKRDWGLPGAVIPHGIDASQFSGYTGEHACVLRVGNLLKEMDIARGFTIGEQIISGFPNKTLGLNPTLEDSRLSESFDDLRKHYQQCRVYLNTLPPDYEDGYNLSLLEAMATGMPVISTAHPESPVKDGHNGFISNATGYLMEKCERLLEDSDEAIRLGRNARETVLQQFPMDRFLSSWNQEIQSCLKNYLKSRGYDRNRKSVAFSERSRKNILMDFVSHPATTAHYLERAFRQTHNVITCGAMINLDVIHQWDLGELKWPIEPQDVFRGSGEGIQKVLDELPADWWPDFYFYVETGLSDIPFDLEELKIPKVCYLIDTHLHLEKHIEIAKRFDVVFLAQKEYVQAVQSQGNSQVFWLPLACDPEIHGKVEVEKEWDVGFVGSITPANPRRKALLDKIGSKFELKVDRKFMDEMARHFCQSRVVFNNAIRNDLNMRVFEAMCTGSMLVTDAAEGVSDLFESGKHYAEYKDENVCEVIQDYLDNPDEREKIARAGREEVLEKHTYSHRAAQVIETLDQVLVSGKKQSVEDCSLENELPEYYKHIRHDLLPLIPEDARSILEIGCGVGNTGRYLKEHLEAFVAGVELNSVAAEKARAVLDDVVTGNIEKLQLEYEPDSFDVILCGDVLEHLIEPLQVLKKLKKFLKPTGKLVASIPNVQFFGVVHHLTEGNWTYQDEGILDRTHLRFFTYPEIVKMFEEAGFQMGVVEETLDPQYESYRKSGQTSLKIGRVTIEDLTPEELRRFFVFQYRFTATLPTLNKAENFQDHVDDISGEISRAKAFEKESRWQEALEVYLGLQQSNAISIAAVEGMGNCYLRLNNPKEAQTVFMKGYDQFPESPEMVLGLAVSAFQLKEQEVAQGWFEKLSKIETHADKGLCGLGMLSQEAGDVRRAMELFARAIQTNCENNTAMTSLLKLSYQSGEFEFAEAALKEFLEIHPANLSVLFGLSGVYFEQGKMIEARETIDQILMFEPEHEDAVKLLEKIQNLSTVS